MRKTLALFVAAFSMLVAALIFGLPGAFTGTCTASSGRWWGRWELKIQFLNSF